MKQCLYALLLATLTFALAACDKDDSGDSQSANGMAVDETRTVEVVALEKWNHSDIDVTAGETFHFSSMGIWTDLATVCTADGYSDETLDAFSAAKRVPEANWFELIASIDSSSYYIIGSDTTITFPETGSLSFFANDADLFYGNNSGMLSTIIVRQE